MVVFTKPQSTSARSKGEHMTHLLTILVPLLLPPLTLTLLLFGRPNAMMSPLVCCWVGVGAWGL